MTDLGLMADCGRLLAARELLAGTATLQTGRRTFPSLIGTVSWSVGRPGVRPNSA